MHNLFKLMTLYYNRLNQLLSSLKLGAQKDRNVLFFFLHSTVTAYIILDIIDSSTEM